MLSRSLLLVLGPAWIVDLHRSVPGHTAVGFPINLATLGSPVRTQAGAAGTGKLGQRPNSLTGLDQNI